MKVFTWFALFIYQVCGVHLVTGRQIYLKVVTGLTDRLSSRTDGSRCLFPEKLKMQLYDGNSTLNFDLHINRDSDMHVPVYITDVTSEGKHYIYLYDEKKPLKDAAAYQDLHSGSYVLVQCSTSTSSPYQVEGIVYVQGKRYSLEKASSRMERPKRETTHPNNPSYDVYNIQLVPEPLPRYFEDFVRIEDLPPPELSSLDTSSDKSRSPRQAVEDYYVDVIVIVDVDIYKGFLTLSNNVADNAVGTVRRYFAHVINGVNLRYKTITDVGFNIHVRLIGYVIAQSEVASPWTERTKTIRNGRVHVDADDVLEALKLWVNSVNNMPKHDHAMLFTGYDLYGEDSGFSSNYTTGLAYIGTMCQGEGRSVSVVEDHGGFQSVGTAAHELGHSLGAEHDGLNNTCTPADRYIMAGASYNETSDNKYNPWRFSPCSIKYIKTYVDSVVNNVKESTCLRLMLTPIGVPNVTNEMPGQLLGPDEQCRHIYGPTSYLCRGENFGDATDVCRAMFCRNPKTTNKCVLHVAARGTSCGNKRWCVTGQCVGHVNAPSRPRGCPFGDQTGVVSGGNTCTQIVTEASGYCYVKDFRTRCCSSCDSIHTGVYGCEYGDRVLDCQTKYCGRKFKDGTMYDTDCCGTCNYAPPTTTRDPNLDVTPAIRCRDQPEIDEISCHDYVASAGKYKCYRIDVYNTCCRTCENMKEARHPSCPWGDRDPQECSKLASNVINTCSEGMRTRCCDTCDAIAKRTNPTSSFLMTSPFPTFNAKSGSARNCQLPFPYILSYLLAIVTFYNWNNFALHL